jgi:hypothetical protein
VTWLKSASLPLESEFIQILFQQFLSSSSFPAVPAKLERNCWKGTAGKRKLLHFKCKGLASSTPAAKQTDFKILFYLSHSNFTSEAVGDDAHHT